MEAVLWGGSFFISGLFLQELWIYVQRRLKVSQVQKSYGVGIDVQVKSETPSMGGVIFLFLAVSACIVNPEKDVLLFFSLPVAGGLIGLVDDGLKFLSRSSEGFRSLKKLLFQFVISAVWVALVCRSGNLYLWPGIITPLYINFFLAILGCAGIMNAVNITDGLDGMAGGCFLISIGVLCFLLPMTQLNKVFLSVLFAMGSSFLFVNIHPARTFMGDTGAHFLGGALAALCIQNGMILALIPVSFLFALELLSSAVQIVAIRKFKRKIFRMAPLHHHFQRMGWDETTVTMKFCLAHAVGAIWLTVLFSTFLS